MSQVYPRGDRQEGGGRPLMLLIARRHREADVGREEADVLKAVTMCSSDKRLVCMRKNGLGRNERRSLEHSQIKLLSRCVSLAVLVVSR